MDAQVFNQFFARRSTGVMSNSGGASLFFFNILSIVQSSLHLLFPIALSSAYLALNFNTCILNATQAFLS